MRNNRRKRNKEKLLESFGNIKDDLFYFEQIERYFRKRDNSNAFQVLSDKTCNDLDLQELFMFVDRTKMYNNVIANTYSLQKCYSIVFYKNYKIFEEFIMENCLMTHLTMN